MENKTETTRKRKQARIPIWLMLVLCGVIICMALAISFLVLLHLDIIRCVPADAPSAQATPEPTDAPTTEPQIATPEPTAEPTAEPTEEPTPEPTEEPTPEPTATPTVKPQATPKATATAKPSSFKFGGKTIKAGTTVIDGSKLGINGKSSSLRHIKKDEVQNLIELCPDLEELTLEYCYMDDYTPLGKLTKLKKLTLSRCYNGSKGKAIVDIDWIKTLTNLTYLKLRHNKITDVTALTGLKKLTELNLGENRLSNNDLKRIAKITSLTTLYLYNEKELTDVTELAKLTKLTFLSLGKNSKLENIKPLTGLVYLKQLRLYNTKFSDTSYLKDFAQLEKIDLSGCPITFKAYYHLENVGTLRHIVLSKSDKDGSLAIDDMINNGARLDISYDW